MRIIWAVLLGLVTSGAALAQNSLLPAPAGSLQALNTADQARDWRAIGRLDTGTSFCSATLIAPRLVLTAAHCLFAPDGARIPNDRLTFAASLRNGTAAAIRRVSQSFVPESYARPMGQPSFDTVSDDIALLELSQPISEANIRPISIGRSGRVRELVSIVSYGRDREHVASLEEDCRILAQQRPVQVLSCSVVEGSSGAPILRETGAGLEVIAVISAIGAYRDEDAAIAVALDDILPELMLAYNASRSGVLSRTPGIARRLSAGNDGREGIGARFIRP